MALISQKAINDDWHDSNPQIQRQVKVAPTSAMLRTVTFVTSSNIILSTSPGPPNPSLSSLFPLTPLRIRDQSARHPFLANP